MLSQRLEKKSICTLVQVEFLFYLEKMRAAGITPQTSTRILILNTCQQLCAEPRAKLLGRFARGEMHLVREEDIVQSCLKELECGTSLVADIIKKVLEVP